MGEVYKATDTRLDRTVGIKVLPHVPSDPERKQRFEREAKTVAALSHPHICPVFDVGFEVPSPPRGEGQGEGDTSPIDFLKTSPVSGTSTCGSAYSAEGMAVSDRTGCLYGCVWRHHHRRHVRTGDLTMKAMGEHVFASSKGSSQIHIVQNWVEELQARVPTGR